MECLKPSFCRSEAVDEGVDEPDRVLLVNVFVESVGEEYGLVSVKTRHVLLQSLLASWSAASSSALVPMVHCYNLYACKTCHSKTSNRVFTQSEMGSELISQRQVFLCLCLASVPPTSTPQIGYAGLVRISSRWNIFTPK